MQKKIFIIAGEASGDILGADLMNEILKLNPHISFYGVGGDEMQKIKSFKSIFNIKDIAVMGFIEIFKNIFVIKKRLKQVHDAILSIKPDIVITIDAPGFNFQVVKNVKPLLQNTKFIHYVAPQVWAWKEKRAKKVASLYDYLICFFDFELPYFEKYGLKTFSVGHTAIENVKQDLKDFFKQYNISKNDIIITMIPGSRIQMAKKIMPIFKQVALQLSNKFKKLKIIIPVVSTSSQYINDEIKNWNIKPILVETKQDRYNSFFISDVVVSISGTAVLEVGVAKTPVIVVYKLSSLSYFIAKHLVRIKNVSLPNIIMGKSIIPELIQNDCNADNIIANISKILNNKKYRDNMVKNLTIMSEKLYKNGKSPSYNAGKIVIDILNN